MVGEGDRIDVAARLSSRRFGGFESLQLEVRDAALAGRLPTLGDRPLQAVGPGLSVEPALPLAATPGGSA